MTFTTIEQIRREFGLTESEPTELRKQLRKLQADLHPDRHSGTFASEADEQRYLRIENAIEFLDRSLNGEAALIPVKSLGDLVQVIQGLVPVRQGPDVEAKLQEQIAHRVAAIGSQYLFPKVSVSSIAAVLTALWMFPSVVAGHPVLSRLMDVTSMGFAIVWICSLVGTAFVWTYARMLEDRQREFASRLKTEGFQNLMFKDFLRCPAYEYPFTKDSFVKHMMTQRPPRSRPMGRIFANPYAIDVDLALALTDVIFARAEAKGVIRKVDGPYLSDCYSAVSLPE